MSSHILEKDITDLIGISEVPEEDRKTFLEDVGNLILESTVTRLMADMSDDEKKAFEIFVSEVSGQDDMLEKMGERYPKALSILEEEVAAFKKEAIAVLGAGERE